jgi:HK97 family phage major capsid protein
MSTRLEYLNGQIRAKREELASVLQAKPNRDFSTEELGKIKGLNDELAPLVEEQEGLKAVHQIIDETESYLSKNNPVGEKLPTGQEKTAIGIQMPNGDVLSLRNEKGDLLPDSQIAERIAEYAKSSVDRSFTPDFEPGGFGSRKADTALATAFINSAAFKQYDPVSRKSPTVELEVKTLLDTTGFPVFSQRSNMLIPYPLRRPVVADLMPNGTISQPRFLYMEEITSTNNAAPVAEAGTKPESALAFEEKDAPVRKIATVLPVTDELFQDAPAMRSYVQGRMTIFLQLAEENQLLNGSGVAPALEGIYTNAGIQTQAKGADTIPDAIYKAATKVEVNSFLSASGVVIHPNDWQRVRLLKDSTGNYLFGSPMSGDIERIFGYPVVKTQATAEGTALVGAFDTAAMVLRRTGISFAVSTEHSDFFITNKLMLRIEERLAFPIFRPTGFCEVTGLNA